MSTHQIAPSGAHSAPGFIYDPDIDMPWRAQARNHAFNMAARDCYALRNAAEHYGDFAKSQDYHDMGDVYLGRAIALTEEWST